MFSSLERSWRSYQRRYGAHYSLELFARHVVKYPEPFRKHTRLDAKYYLNYLEKKGYR